MANPLSMPSSSGGLMRYTQEYNSKLKFKPSHVVLFIISIIIFVAVLKIFFPIGA